MMGCCGGHGRRNGHLRLQIRGVWIVEYGNDRGHAVGHSRHHEAQAEGSYAAHQPVRPLLLVVCPQPPKACLSLKHSCTASLISTFMPSSLAMRCYKEHGVMRIRELLRYRHWPLPCIMQWKQIFVQSVCPCRSKTLSRAWDTKSAPRHTLGSSRLALSGAGAGAGSLGARGAAPMAITDTLTAFFTPCSSGALADT